MSINPREDTVDLYTDSAYLDNLMLSECPIRFYENQRTIIKIQESRFFMFSDLPKKELLDYLDSINEYLGQTSYLVTSSDQKRIIRLRNLDGFV